MNGMPDLLFVIDVRKEDIAIKEASKLDIPIVAVVDTNCSPEGIDHVIPGNDDALRAIRLFASRIADAIIEGRQVGTEGGIAVAEETTGEEGTDAVAATPEIALESIPKEFLNEDEVAEIESADIPEPEEEDDEAAAPETAEVTENAAADVADAAPESSEDKEAKSEASAS